MAEIPGYWRDPNTGKYFKIGPGFSPPKLGFGKPKTLSELHPINCKPTNRNSSKYTGNNFMMSDSEFGGHACPNLCLSTKACPRVFALSSCEYEVLRNLISELFSLSVRLFLTSILKNQRDLYLRNRPLNGHHANSGSSIRKILVTGRENVTNIEPDFLNFNENSFTMSKSGEMAVTSNNLWLKERNDSGGVLKENVTLTVMSKLNHSGIF